MKIYTRVRINMATGEEVETEHFDYDGPVARCGGGSGAAGKVQYPNHIAMAQLAWMSSDGGYLDPTPGNAFMGSDMTEAMDTALGNSPWEGEVAFDPDTRLTAIDTEVTAWTTIVDALEGDEESKWEAYLVAVAHASTGIPGSFGSTTLTKTTPSTTTPTGVTTGWIDPTPAADAEITADVDAYEAIVDDHVEIDVLPRFQRGMQDIGAVMSSAFTIGQAIIEGMADRDVAKYQGQIRTQAYLQKDALVAQSKLRESERVIDLEMQVDEIASREDMQANQIASQEEIAESRIQSEETQLENRSMMMGIEQMLRYFSAHFNYQQGLSEMTIRAQALGIAAQKEEADTQSIIDEANAKWDLEVFQYGANLIAAGGGGTMVPGAPPRMSRTASTAAGAASMAAAGGQASGSWYGAAIGAVVGGAIGYYSNE